MMIMMMMMMMMMMVVVVMSRRCPSEKWAVFEPVQQRGGTEDHGFGQLVHLSPSLLTSEDVD
jgi:hypothetical protein